MPNDLEDNLDALDALGELIDRHWQNLNSLQRSAYLRQYFSLRLRLREVHRLSYARDKLRRVHPMAKIMFGAAVTDARGKLAGIVYSKNAAGAYIRAKVSPTQSLTSRRGVVRERITNLSKYFSGSLTAAQVAAWNSFAKNNPVSNVFGHTVILSGIQTFCRLNAAILNVGGTQIDDPPASLAITGITSLSATAAAGTPALSIVFGPSPLDTNVRLNIFATQQLPPGRTFTKSYMRWLAASSAAATTPYNALSAYTAKFGALVAGTKIGIKANVVDETTGAQTTGLYTLITVAA